ncbi:MAG: sigma-54 dependent transcriptional regulator [Candidatus Fermentibacteraceae bacterium]
MTKQSGRRYRVLVVDDDPQIRRLLAEVLQTEGYSCETVWAAREAMRVLRRQSFDLLITDLNLPDRSGLDLLDMISSRHPGLPVIVITGYASIESTKQAIRRGALDYIPKPFSGRAVVSAIERALQSPGGPRGGRGDIIYRSETMEEIMSMVRRVSRSDSTVLVTGESGTGKELVARALHRMSRRQSQQFVSVNSGALPENLLESELFGHRKGAFTGAVSTTLGRFQVADGGTLFLDEVGNMSPGMQVKLLRALQEGEVSPVGSTETQKVDVRLIAATNMNLEVAVREGAFREDLFYRLNVIEINLPPLRHRREDIMVLAEHFLGIYSSRRSNGRKLDISGEAAASLLAYSWPGNVRELENTIERACVLARGSPIQISDLPGRVVSGVEGLEETRMPEGGVNLPMVMENLERYYIVNALRRHGGVKARAARWLGLKRTTFLAKMKKLGIPEETGKR